MPEQLKNCPFEEWKKEIEARNDNIPFNHLNKNIEAEKIAKRAFMEAWNRRAHGVCGDCKRYIPKKEAEYKLMKMQAASWCMTSVSADYDPDFYCAKFKEKRDE